jgi:ankyrin repeat protein
MQDMFEADAFSYAVRMNSTDCIRLIAPKLDLNKYRMMKTTVLHKFVEEPSVIELMVTMRGISPDVRDSNGKTCLMEALSRD